MRIHYLKTWPDWYQDVIDGTKKVEIRLNDRKFEVGDILNLKEFDNETKKYTGRHYMVHVTHMVEGGMFGLEKVYVAMSIAPVEIVE